MTGHFTQADTIIPEPGKSQSFDRYAYTENNPIRYSDLSGHFPLPIVIAIGLVFLKVVDYGWTAFDLYQSSQIIADPKSTLAEKDAARNDIALAVTLELIEPDDNIPVGIPLDDLVRKGIIKVDDELLQESSKILTDDVFIETSDSFFSGKKWINYPTDICPRPKGQLRIIEGEEYALARNKANIINERIHSLNRPKLDKYQIHEVQPVKFGGNPTSLSNKVLVNSDNHQKLNKWWIGFRKGIEE